MGRRLNGEMKLNRGTAGNTTNLFVLRFPGLLYTFRPMLRVYIRVCVRLITEIVETSLTRRLVKLIPCVYV